MTSEARQLNKWTRLPVKGAMIRPLLITMMAMWTLVGGSQAAETAEPLEDMTARHLVAGILDIRSTNVKIGSIIEGRLHEGPRFSHRQACRVTAVVKVVEKGALVRKVKQFDFVWSASTGWFHQEILKEPGGETIRIWSERCGDYTVK